jgi:hypothetical protein
MMAETSIQSIKDVGGSRPEPTHQDHPVGPSGHGRGHYRRRVLPGLRTGKRREWHRIGGRRQQAARDLATPPEAVRSSRRPSPCVPSPPFCQGGARGRIPVAWPKMSVLRSLVLKAQEYLGVVIEDLVDVLGRQACFSDVMEGLPVRLEGEQDRVVAPRHQVIGAEGLPCAEQRRL